MKVMDLFGVWVLGTVVNGFVVIGRAAEAACWNQQKILAAD